jgi:pyruvate kinase
MRSVRAVSRPAVPHRTKIVATIGPASASDAVLARLIAAGMNVARINFSHGTRTENGRLIARIRRTARRAGVQLAIMQDLQGPKIRVGVFAQPVRLTPGEEVVLTTRPVLGDARRIPVAFPNFTALVRKGQRVLLRDGMIELRVLARARQDVRCRVVEGGVLDSQQGVNLPGVPLSGSSLTRKDIADLRYGLRAGVDFVALSFVRSARDLRSARRLMRRAGRAAPLVSKLERLEAIGNLDEIVAESDAVMVARGDLGVELPPEDVPLLQKRIIRAANERGVPVIVATQMLESMVRDERPTRAETSDVANAVLDGTDAVMLSAETAVGRYPVESVATMARIARAVEADERPPGPGPIARPTLLQSIADAATTIADDCGVRLIVVLTETGRAALAVSRLRPSVPILACTGEERIARRLSLAWGIQPLVVPFRANTEAMIRPLDGELVRRGLVRSCDPIVIVGSAPIVARGRTNFVQYHLVGASRA